MNKDTVVYKAIGICIDLDNYSWFEKNRNKEAKEHTDFCFVLDGIQRDFSLQELREILAPEFNKPLSATAQPPIAKYCFKCGDRLVCEKAEGQYDIYTGKQNERLRWTCPPKKGFISPHCIYVINMKGEEILDINRIW